MRAAARTRRTGGASNRERRSPSRRRARSPGRASGAPRSPLARGTLRRRTPRRPDRRRNSRARTRARARRRGGGGGGDPRQPLAGATGAPYARPVAPPPEAEELAGDAVPVGR